MIGVKGLDFLDSIWDKAELKGCKCETSSHFSQDFLGAVSCDKCKSILISQTEVNDMENKNVLPIPTISIEKLNSKLGVRN